MNPYLEPAGFLGTGASLLADITLIAYLLLIIPAMLIGFWYARRGKHRPHHKYLMNGVTILNWVLIIFLMIAAYRFDVIDNITNDPTNARYLLPTIHGILGIPAQLLATFILVRMEIEDRSVAAAKRRGETNLRKYWFLRAKPVMQITLWLWLATAALGVASYLVRYNVISFTAGQDGGLPPVATEEVVVTPEVIATAELFDDDFLVVTPEVEFEDDDDDGLRSPVATAEVRAGSGVVVTPEVAFTPEVEDDDDDSRREDDDDSGNSGRGSGNNGSGSSNSGSGSRDDDD